MPTCTERTASPRAPAGPRRCCCTTTSTAGCGRRRSLELAARGRPRAARPTTPSRCGRWFAESADSGSLERYLETFDHTVAVMQTADGARAGSPASAWRTWPPTAWCTPRSATPPSSTSSGGLTLDEVVGGGPATGFDEGDGRRAGGRDRRPPAADRDAAPGPLAGDRRAGRRLARPRASSASTSPAPRRATRRPGTSTRSSTSSARTPTSPSTPARRSGCRRSGRRSSGAAPTGSATASGSSTTSPSTTTARPTLGPARGVRPRQADPARDVPVLQRPDRRRRRRSPSTRSGCSPSCASGSRSTPTTG